MNVTLHVCPLGVDKSTDFTQQHVLVHLIRDVLGGGMYTFLIVVYNMLLSCYAYKNITSYVYRNTNNNPRSKKSSISYNVRNVTVSICTNRTNAS